MAQTKQIKAANVLNKAFTAGVTGGDGATLFSGQTARAAGHPTIAGNFVNELLVSADLSETSLEHLFD